MQPSENAPCVFRFAAVFRGQAFTERACGVGVGWSNSRGSTVRETDEIAYHLSIYLPTYIQSLCHYIYLCIHLSIYPYAH